MLSTIVLLTSIMAGGSDYWDYVGQNYMIKSNGNVYYSVINNKEYVFGVNCNRKTIHTIFNFKGKEVRGSSLLASKRSYGQLLYTKSCKRKLK